MPHRSQAGVLKTPQEKKEAHLGVSVQPPEMLMCPQVQVGENLQFTGQQSLTRSSGFFICVWKETRVQASLHCFPLSSTVLAPIHRQPLIQHSWLEDRFSSYIICQPRGSKKKKESEVMKLKPRK